VELARQLVPGGERLFLVRLGDEDMNCVSQKRGRPQVGPQGELDLWSCRGPRVPSGDRWGAGGERGGIRSCGYRRSEIADIVAACPTNASDIIFRQPYNLPVPGWQSWLHSSHTTPNGNVSAYNVAQCCLVLVARRSGLYANRFAHSFTHAQQDVLDAEITLTLTFN
jgi:hypothetical protein